MSMHERTGHRDLTYSAWHRPASIKQYLSNYQAQHLTMIDIDWCEYCPRCSMPLAFVETQHGDRPPKPAPVTEKVAQLVGVPIWSVSYLTNAANQIVAFRRRILWPPLPEQRVTPATYAGWLWDLRTGHLCVDRRSPYGPFLLPPER